MICQRYTLFFSVLHGLVAVGDEVGVVALQVRPMDGEVAGDAVEVLQQEFGHGDAFGGKGVLLALARG